MSMVRSERKPVESKPAPVDLNCDLYYIEFAYACAKIIPDKDCSKYFKRYDTKELPRVTKIIGILKGIGPSTVMDVGSGRGRLLWPMMFCLPNTSFISVEVNEWRLRVINSVSQGGVGRLRGMEQDISDGLFASDVSDVVVASEVLEHIPDVQTALNNIVRSSKKYIIITVPSKPDNNPDHVHFFQQDDFRKMFYRAEKVLDTKVDRLTFDYTPKEMIVYARIKGD